MFSKSTLKIKSALIACAVILFTSIQSMAVTINVSAVTATLSNMQDATYSGPLVPGSLTLRYPGLLETIVVSGSSGFKTDAILIVDKSLTIGKLVLGSSNPSIGFVIIRDGITLTVDQLNAVNSTKLNGINASAPNFTGNLNYVSWIDRNYNIGAPVSIISALPVDFISFTATKLNKSIMLNFSTAWEVNNRGFEVERSTNGTNWMNIGFVAGNGNTNAISNYTFPTSLAGINASVVYYRLKQVDFNGQFEYSEVRSIRINGAATVAQSIYPNPAASKISVTLNGVPAGETANITIMDMTGKVVLAANQIIEEANFTLDLNIENLKKGNYIVNITSATTSSNTKLIKL